MDRQQFESMQLERFRRAAERELERERLNRALARRVWGVALVFILGSAAAAVEFSRVAARVEVLSVDDTPPAVWATRGEPPDAGAITRPMPAAPFKGQARPPCERDEVAIREACWLELARKPPPDGCGRKGFEHEGKCYLPIQREKPPPVGVAP